MNEKELESTLEIGLSDFEFSSERRQAVFRAIHKTEKGMKRKTSAAFVLAVVLSLLVVSATLAVSLGVFGQAANRSENELSSGRLQKLEIVSETYGDTQTAKAPEPILTETLQTEYEALMASLYDCRFSLSLNQAYFDGYKLYYAYTLTCNGANDFITGEGMPSGFAQWDSVKAGRYASRTAYDADDPLMQQVAAYFAAHPLGYIAYISMRVGDGADMDGQPLTILDSDSQLIDNRTIQGFQEVQIPDGFELANTLSIELPVSYGIHVWAQDEQNLYDANLKVPEDRGFLRLPFTVKLSNQAETYTGSVETGAYRAQATVRVSDVDINGEVVFDAPEWAAAFEADDGGKHLTNLPYIHTYTLIADGVEYSNIDGGFGVNKNGQFFIRIRYDLPESRNSLTLVPIGTGIDFSAKPAQSEKPERENEEIILLKSPSDQ